MVNLQNTEILANLSNQRITFMRKKKNTDATLWGNVYDGGNKVGNNCQNFISKYLHVMSPNS